MTPASENAEVDTRQSAYRCAECGHGRRLYAIAPCNATGPLGADGELAHHDDVTGWGGVYEDSIQCDRHPDAAVEKLAAGEWRRWWSCESCDGSGRRHIDGYSYSCPSGTPAGAHSGWLTPSRRCASASADEATV